MDLPPCLNPLMLVIHKDSLGISLLLLFCFMPWTFPLVKHRTHAMFQPKKFIKILTSAISLYGYNYFIIVLHILIKSIIIHYPWEVQFFRYQDILFVVRIRFLDFEYLAYLHSVTGLLSNYSYFKILKHLCLETYFTFLKRVLFISRGLLQLRVVNWENDFFLYKDSKPVARHLRFFQKLLIKLHLTKNFIKLKTPSISAF